MNNPGTNENYTILISKLDHFIRKYYTNRMVRGGLLVLGILLLTYLVISVTEYFGHFNILVRTFLFYLYLLANLMIIVYFILIPLLNIYRIGKIISHRQAAKIIGDHFTDVKDKLLNVLQLREMADKGNEVSSIELIHAGIDQKTYELKPIPFSSAINFLENRKYLKFTVIPLAIVLLILAFSPRILTESTKRLVNHGTFYEKDLPFHFFLLNKDLKTARNSDFTVRLKIEGEKIPDEVYIYYEGSPYLMNRSANNQYHYTIRNLRNDLDFHFIAHTIESRTWELMVLPKPVLVKFQVKIDYPAYVHKESTVTDNTGDLTIPIGSQVHWKFYTSDADRLMLAFQDTNINLHRSEKDKFDYKRTFLKNDFYGVIATNNYLVNSDSIRYYINIIPDAYPRIRVKQETDTISKKLLFFSGEISDDYGFSKLAFVYKFTESKDTNKLREIHLADIKFDASKNDEDFFHSWDMNQVPLQPGDAIEYFFAVWDNDGINGPKQAVSDKFFFKAPTLEELGNQTDKLSTDFKNDIQQMERKAKDLQNDIQKAQKNLLENKDLKWEDKKFIENIIKKQEGLKENLDQLKKKYIENVMNQDDNKSVDEEMLKKYDELYKMFDQLMPDEIKDLYKQLDQLLDKNMKDKIPENMDKMNMNNKEMNKELDRMLEQFKKLELEQKAENIESRLNELSKKQDDLANKTEGKNPDKEELKKEQDQLNKEFDNLKKDMDEMDKLNKELEQPMPLDDLKPDQKEIGDEMNKSMENLNENKANKAAGHQKNASEKMKKLAEKMQAMMDEGEMEMQEIDIQKLRRILQNTLYVSFEQEKVMNEFAKVNSYNPQYIELTERQNKLKSYSKMIEDSLFSLSKQVSSISSIVNREIGEINFNYSQLIDLMALRDAGNARIKQHYILTSVNNLALLLSEILEQMKQQQSNSTAKSGKGTKKGKSNKPSANKKPGSGLPNLRKLQEELNKKIGQCKSGQMPGGNNPSSEEIMRIAREQAMLRSALQRIANEQNKNGNDKFLKGLNDIQKLMEKSEKELVNKKITPELLERQKEITVKLLESEKAEMKQELQEKRESKTARDIFNPNPPTLDQYKKMKLKEVELLQTIPPALNDYYRMKVREYFNQIK